MVSKSDDQEYLDTIRISDEENLGNSPKAFTQQETSKKVIEELSEIEMLSIQNRQMVETNDEGHHIRIKNIDDFNSMKSYSLKESDANYKSEYYIKKDQDQNIKTNSSAQYKESDFLKKDSDTLNITSEEATAKTDSKIASDHNAFLQKRKEVNQIQERLARYIANNIQHIDIYACMKVFENIYYNGSKEDDFPKTYQTLFFQNKQTVNFKEFSNSKKQIGVLIIDLKSKAMLRIPAYVTPKGSQIVDNNIEIHDINEIIDKFIDESSEIAYVNLFGPNQDYEPNKGFRYTWQARFINVRNPYSYNSEKLTKTIGLFCLDCFSMLSGIYVKDELSCPYNNLNKLKFVSKMKDVLPQVTYLQDKRIVVEINRKKITTFFLLHLQRQINDDIRTRQILHNNDLSELPFWLTSSFGWRWAVSKGRGINQNYNFGVVYDNSVYNQNELTERASNYDHDTMQRAPTDRVMSAHPNAVIYSFLKYLESDETVSIRVFSSIIT